MSQAEFVAYYRVSTQRHGASGLGLEAQRAAVAAHVATTGSLLLAEYTEIESGRKAQRPELDRALAQCRSAKAVLVIAKLDRLARNVAFLSALMDGATEFLALDLPGASRFHLHIMAAVAEHEARAISERTKAALKAAKARGQILGTPANLTDASRQASAVSRRAVVAERHRLTVPLVAAWRKANWTLEKIAATLTELRVPLPRGGDVWTPPQVRRLLTVARKAKPKRRGRERVGRRRIAGPPVADGGSASRSTC